MMYISMRSFVLTLLFVIFVMPIVTPMTSHSQTRISYNIFVPPSHFMWSVMEDWASQVKERSGGSLEIVFTAKSVAPPPKVLDAVRKGAADAGFVANIFLGPDTPGPLVGLMPWIHRGDSEATSLALWRTYQEYFEEVERDSWKGVELLGLFHFAGGGLCSLTDEPIESVDDLRSRKLWVLPGNLANMMKNMDVSIVTGPAVQIHEFVSRNTVEAYMGITYDSILKFKVAPYTKSCTQFTRSPFAINFSHYINSRVWSGLSDSDKQVLRDLSGEHLARMVGKKVNEQALKGRDKLGETAEYVTASQEFIDGIASASAPIVDAWVEKVSAMGVDGRAAMEFMRSEVDRLSKINAN